MKHPVLFDAANVFTVVLAALILSPLTRGQSGSSNEDFQKGMRHYEAAEYAQAATAFKRVIDSSAILGLGVAHLELKDRDAALEQHKRLAAIDMERADKLYAYITDKKIPLAVLNGKALSLPKPSYPVIARAAHASGTVQVWVSIDETGKVVSASVVTGHPLLRVAALEAAKLARFTPTMLDAHPVKVTGILAYNFVAD